MQNAVKEILNNVHDAGAGKAMVVFNDEEEQPVAFVYACIEASLARVLLPLIEQAEAEHDKEDSE